MQLPPDIEAWKEINFHSLSEDEITGLKQQISERAEPITKQFEKDGIQIDPASWLNTRFNAFVDILVHYLKVPQELAEIMVARRDLELLDFAKGSVAEQAKQMRQAQLLESMKITEEEARSLGLFGNNGKPQ